MPKPSSKMKIRKDGVEFRSNVDAANWTIQELTRAALYDSAKLLRKRIIDELKKLPGMKRHRRPYRVIGYWVRRREGDLQIGFGHTKKGNSGDTWYGIQQELGTSGQPKRGIMRNTVFENIDEMRKVQAQYLSAITTDTADKYINEDEYESPDGEE